jgi:HEAT repeat protein
VLFALAAPDKLARMGHIDRELIVESLINLGPAHKDQLIPTLTAVLEVEGSILAFKDLALMALARYGSDAGAPHCTKVLSAGVDKNLLDGCIRYLGQAKVASALPALTRILEQKRELVVRAMGQIGDPAAIPILEAHLAGNYEPTAVVALINLGKEEYLPKLELMIAGKRPLSAKDEARLKEELGKAKDRGKVQARWDKDAERVYDELAQDAAMECTVLTSPAAQKRVHVALTAMAQVRDPKRWKMGRYATIALAQHGDAAAIAEVGKMLSDPDEHVRNAALAAMGGAYTSPTLSFELRGLGVIADPSLLPVLFAYVDAEPRKEKRTEAFHAIAAIRSFTP